MFKSISRFIARQFAAQIIAEAEAKAAQIIAKHKDAVVLTEAEEIILYHAGRTYFDVMIQSSKLLGEHVMLTDDSGNIVSEVTWDDDNIYFTDVKVKAEKPTPVKTSDDRPSTVPSHYIFDQTIDGWVDPKHQYAA